MSTARPSASATASATATACLALLALVGAVPAESAAPALLSWWQPLSAPRPIPVAKEEVHSVPIDSTTPMIIARYGYPSETHTIQTEDGYLLTAHRISNPGKPAVYLQHGILSSSADFVVLGPEKALGFLLYDAGYDVWLGNSRGNTYSRAHVKMAPSDKEFWNFSWHEMGMHDLPAMIDFILAATRQESLVYVAHSQGTTAFLVMASMRPEYNDKVKAFIALAPVAFMGKVRSLPLKIIAKGTSELGFVMNVLGVGEFMPSNAFVTAITSVACADGSVLQSVCTNLLFLITGFDSEQLETDKLPEIMQNVPAGAATKQLLHYGQLINSDKFRQYDLGVFQNLLQYGKLSPPKYPLDKITTKVFLHYGPNDLVAVPREVERLSKALTNVRMLRKVPYKKYNHLDFLYGRESKTLVYATVIESVQEVHGSEVAA